MIYLLVHHEVADYPKWKAAFDSALDWRTRHGEHNCRIFRGVQNPNDLTLMFEWESADKARAFIASDELKTRMASAGVKSTPRVEYLTEMFTIRRSAADQSLRTRPTSPGSPARYFFRSWNRFGPDGIQRTDSGR